MLVDLLIFAVVLVGLDIGVKLLLGLFAVNKIKSKARRIVSFKLADWHYRRYEKLSNRK